ncbi:hypothetical protein QBC37DRAFT_416162 [Rhypophila decipiens]|uniref:N-acetyltransferase domain-containing protein n=1 Tax=Rhypophila decipiens TaxID=261697 RepID=A0AAN6YDT3_9PEZI|nr:hypothetical protein QBC37DRAFT_416162 [Rhypophila decipiens]
MVATQPPLPINIMPLQYADIPIVSRNTASAFAVDPHTLVKQLGKGGYDMYAISSSGFLDNLGKKNYMHFKAVSVDPTTNDDTGETTILGHISWAFRGVSDQELDKMPRPHQPPITAEEATNTIVTVAAEDENTTTTAAAAVADDEEATNKIQRLHDLEDEDMQAWMSSIVPPGPCIFVTGLIVAPGYQSRGVGSRLLQKLNETADAMGLCVWVHSSHQAYRAYHKAGFEVTRVLELDLDEWATRGPREDEAVMGDLNLDGTRQGGELGGNGLEEGEQGQRKWGRYIIRYLKREPRFPASSV